MREALNKLGDFSEMDVTSILNEADVDKSGGIEFDEFCKFVAPRLLKVPPPANEIKAAFDVSPVQLHENLTYFNLVIIICIYYNYYIHYFLLRNMTRIKMVSLVLMKLLV